MEYCVREGEIHKQTFDYLTSLQPRTARLYLLPKIHKKCSPVPCRPVVSSNGSPTEKISEFVDFFLKPFVSSTKSYLKDTTDFLRKLQHLGKVPKGAILFTMDVVSLYTNIPTDMGISYIRDFLEKNRVKGAKPSNEVLIKLLEFVLTMNEFEFNEEFFLQLFGTAIGTRVAPSYANLVMAIFEELFLFLSEWWKFILLYFRFIDDCFGIWLGTLQQLLEFVDYLNSKVDSIKFTLEYSTLNIPFLDVLVGLTENGEIYTDLFKKETDARNYLNYTSAHPMSCKKGIPYGQFLRIRRICSDIRRFDVNAIEMAHSFMRRGYPENLVFSSLVRARRLERDVLLIEKDKEKKEAENESIFLIQTFTPGQNVLGDIVDRNIDYLKKNPNLRDFSNVNITKAFRKPKCIKDYVVRASLKSKSKHIENKPRCKNSKCRYCPLLDKSGKILCYSNQREYSTKTNISCQSNNLIYSITCKKCGKQYVGQTGRRLMDRFQGHFGHIARNENSSLVSGHFNNTGHDGIQDVTIHVLDFIFLKAESDSAKTLRLKIESNWINRLHTAFPTGLNYLE